MTRYQCGSCGNPPTSGLTPALDPRYATGFCIGCRKRRTFVTAKPMTADLRRLAERDGFVDEARALLAAAPSEPHQHQWTREYAPNYRQASEANDWRETCPCGETRTGTDVPSDCAACGGGGVTTSIPTDPSDRFSLWYGLRQRKMARLYCATGHKMHEWRSMHLGVWLTCRRCGLIAEPPSSSEASDE